MTPIFLWRGQYAGFIVNDHLFAPDGRYLGWIDARAKLWKANGAFLGELVDHHYILRRANWTLPVRQTPRVPPVPAQPPMPPGDRLAKLPRPGWVDALEDLLRLPTPEELIGIWRYNDERIEIKADGEFIWTLTTHESVGRWELSGPLLFLRRWLEGEFEVAPAYRILDFSGDELLLRWLTTDRRMGPFALRRVERAADGS